MNVTMTLSRRGQTNADQLDIPWRFAQSHSYDPATNPPGLLSFATAENWLIQKELHDFVSKTHIPNDALRYGYSTAGGPCLTSTFARLFNEFFTPYWQVEGRDIRITAAATGLHDALAFSLGEKGDGILTSRPYYGRFKIDFGNKAGVELVAVDTDHEHCFEENVVKKFEKALQESDASGVKISAVLIVNPHNPLGRCYPRSTLVALMRFCQQHRLHFISDEVYALSIFDNPDFPNAIPFTSALAIDPINIIDPDLVHVIYGLSKDFGAAGLKVGCLVTRNEELKKAITAVQRFSGVGGLSVAVATAMLEDQVWCREFIASSRKRLAEAYLFMTSRLRDIGVHFMEGGNAGFFVWVDLSPWLPPEDEGCESSEREQKLAQKFIDNAVFLQPGEEHGRVGWFRLVFSLERGIVEEGLKRVEKSLKDIRW